MARTSSAQGQRVIGLLPARYNAWFQHSSTFTETYERDEGHIPRAAGDHSRPVAGEPRHRRNLGMGNARGTAASETPRGTDYLRRRAEGGPASPRDRLRHRPFYRDVRGDRRGNTGGRYFPRVAGESPDEEAASGSRD